MRGSLGRGVGCGLSAGRVTDGLRCPLKSFQWSCWTPAREDTVQSSHSEASRPLLQRASHGERCQLCYSRSPFGLIPAGHQPCRFQLDFLTDKYGVPFPQSSFLRGLLVTAVLFFIYFPKNGLLENWHNLNFSKLGF